MPVRFRSLTPTACSSADKSSWLLTSRSGVRISPGGPRGNGSNGHVPDSSSWQSAALTRRRLAVRGRLGQPLYGCSSGDESAILRRSRTHVRIVPAVPNRLGAGPMAGCETLNLEIVVRIHGAGPTRQGASRPRAGRQLPAQPIGVRIVAGPPHHHAVAERQGARLQTSRPRFDSGRRVQHTITGRLTGIPAYLPVSETGVSRFDSGGGYHI